MERATAMEHDLQVQAAAALVQWLRSNPALGARVHPCLVVQRDEYGGLGLFVSKHEAVHHQTAATATDDDGARPVVSKDDELFAIPRSLMLEAAASPGLARILMQCSQPRPQQQGSAQPQAAASAQAVAHAHPPPHQLPPSYLSCLPTPQQMATVLPIMLEATLLSRSEGQMRAQHSGCREPGTMGWERDGAAASVAGQTGKALAENGIPAYPKPEADAHIHCEAPHASPCEYHGPLDSLFATSPALLQALQAQRRALCEEWTEATQRLEQHIDSAGQHDEGAVLVQQLSNLELQELHTAELGSARPCSPELLYSWARCCVWSRAITLWGGPSLVPLADLMNHRHPPTVVCMARTEEIEAACEDTGSQEHADEMEGSQEGSEDDDEGSTCSATTDGSTATSATGATLPHTRQLFVGYAIKDMREGDQVLWSYAAHDSDAHWLCCYGFVPGDPYSSRPEPPDKAVAGIQAQLEVMRGEEDRSGQQVGHHPEGDSEGVSAQEQHQGVGCREVQTHLPSGAAQHQEQGWGTHGSTNSSANTVASTADDSSTSTQQQRQALRAASADILARYRHGIEAVATAPHLPAGMAAAVQTLLHREHDAIADLFKTHSQ